VIPILTVDDEATALCVADALVAGGVTALEITLRTSAGLPALARIRKYLPQLTLAAGTVRSIDDYHAAIDAGADFVVSPGTTPHLLNYGVTAAVPLLPGVATASELLMGFEEGYRGFKFFPAAASGGVTAVKSLLGPFSEAWLVPTGGIGSEDAKAYLDQPNVAAVGGTWLVPQDLIDARDWGGIERLAHKTLHKLA
jgi:2-dehydro-3-deoxyphosphogluconate aldolase/(4S)-4-hydroxy-2-oxoglutarate aldolase